MKQLVAFALLVLFTHAVNAGSSDIKSSGFKDYVFGLTYRAAKELNRDVKEGEALVFGQSPMKEIRFSDLVDGKNADISVRFKSNRLSLIVINFPVTSDELCAEGYIDSKTKLVSAFGNPSRIRKGHTLYWDFAKGVALELSVMPCLQGEKTHSIVLEEIWQAAEG